MMASTVRTVLCLSLCLCLSPVRGSYMTEEMNRTIHNLLQHYRIPPRDRFNGTPVFPKDLLSGRVEVKKMFMGSILETYEKLIGKMLQQLPPAISPTAGGLAVQDAAAPKASAGVRADLMYVLEQVQKLKEHCYQEQSKVLQRLHVLRNIQMNDLTTQSKALGELLLIYEEASSLSNNTKLRRRRRRRRRQARKVKTSLMA